MSSLTPTPEWDDPTTPATSANPDFADDNSAADASPSSDELPGVPLTDEHRAYLISQGITTEYLEQDHVRDCLRSVTRLEELPRTFHHGVNAHQPEGILFAHPDPKTGHVVWRFRPDHPLGNKYLNPKGAGSPISLRSKPLGASPVNHRLVIGEGEKQTLALASAFVNDPHTVVIGLCGRDGGLANGVLASGITYLLKGVDQVIIFPDGDAASNSDVYQSFVALGKAIRARIHGRRGKVRFAHVPAPLDQPTAGIDDVLAALEPEDRLGYVEQLIEEATGEPAECTVC